MGVRDPHRGAGQELGSPVFLQEEPVDVDGPIRIPLISLANLSTFLSRMLELLLLCIREWVTS
jgi:hypothetical protein